MNSKQNSKSRRVNWLVVGVLVVLIAIVTFGYVQLIGTFDTEAVYVYSPLEMEQFERPDIIRELPARLLIPALEIDTAVQHIGLAPDNSGEMDVPSNFTDVGWYEHGVRPGMYGSAVIAGHLDGRDVPEAVFYDLHTLQVGDEVIITGVDSMEDVFIVVRIETYAHDVPTDEVFVSSDGVARLNLITCSGAWMARENVYTERTVVFTEHESNIQYR